MTHLTFALELYEGWSEIKFKMHVLWAVYF
jgi:hypothetical protein